MWMSAATVGLILFMPMGNGSNNAIPECSAASYYAGTCIASVGEDSIVVGASIAEAGAPAVDGPVAPEGNSAGQPAPTAPTQPTPSCTSGVLVCGNTPNAFTTFTTTPTTPAAPVTIADLASFTPAVGELIVQPENWGVLGIPTNFVATATDHVQDGTLLGQPMQVRWRPTAFTFDYGDGTTVTTNDPGTMWEGTDDDWTTTSTSHEYQARGAYTATVTITFEADIATGNGGWSTVVGTLDLAAPAEGVRVFEVQTVLTRGDCIDYPNDPGCTP